MESATTGCRGRVPTPARNWRRYAAGVIPVWAVGHVLDEPSLGGLDQGVGVRLEQLVIDIGRLAIAVVSDERQAGQPTIAARDEILAFFAARLHP